VSENTRGKRNELDTSIDRGLDQFGRFAKLRWFWLLILSIVIWYFIVGIVPQLSAPSPGTILVYAFQIMFAVLFGIMQFVAIFWFLGRPRLYWVMPGETGVTFADYKGNPEVLESARRIVTLLQGIKEFQEMGGQPVRGLLLSGPPGTGKSYLAQCMSTEAGVPFAWFTADEVYGQAPYLREWLEDRDVFYVLAIRCRDTLATAEGQQRADALIAALPARAWQRLSVGAGAHGPREYDWARIPVRTGAWRPGRGHWLLARLLQVCGS